MVCKHIVSVNFNFTRIKNYFSMEALVKGILSEFIKVSGETRRKWRSHEERLNCSIVTWDECIKPLLRNTRVKSILWMFNHFLSQINAGHSPNSKPRGKVEVSATTARRKISKTPSSFHSKDRALLGRRVWTPGNSWSRGGDSNPLPELKRGPRAVAAAINTPPSS
jgi:hypothetical protein